ncbi:hypothetical protein JWG45_21090 [Leptospira sp. 201903070]|uniref:TIGR04452 family lipoprotein n=1 Tax=Leptospira ainlahdjerensis TaxID=2810033 RepID=A0ABS2UJD2_9LEPT|nr:hypothetical protein [Leptospira ainlahdjerensis]MBM9579647.1 hypothetical protein [Leptospira ainlahdjerensis]
MKWTFFLSLAVLILLYRCSGIAGPQLVNDEDFRTRKLSAIRLKLLLCVPMDPSQISSKKTDSGESILAGVITGFSSAIPGKSVFYLEKDVEYCELSLFAAPCGNSTEEFWINHMNTLIQSCEPKIACMGGKEHPGTGTFCLD